MGLGVSRGVTPGTQVPSTIDIGYLERDAHQSSFLFYACFDMLSDRCKTTRVSLLFQVNNFLPSPLPGTNRSQVGSTGVQRKVDSREQDFLEALMTHGACTFAIVKCCFAHTFY